MRTEEQRKKHRENMRRWKAANPQRARELGRESWNRNRDAINARRRANWKEYYLRNRDNIKRSQKEFHERNPHYEAMIRRNWRKKNPEKDKAISDRFLAKHRDRILAERRRKRRLNINGYRDRQEQWRKNNRDKVILARRRRYPIRRQSLAYRIECSLRARINAFVRGTRNKSASTISLLGCSLDDFKIYLESKFESGMTWENYGKGSGKWNIDHIMPCAIFDLTKPEHQRRCFHFSNMQPLWEPENIRKHAKVLTNQFQLL